jgi:hypothetical protein
VDQVAREAAAVAADNPNKAVVDNPNKVVVEAAEVVAAMEMEDHIHKNSHQQKRTLYNSH